jgi:hypothetical protein
MKQMVALVARSLTSTSDAHTFDCWEAVALYLCVRLPFAPICRQLTRGRPTACNRFGILAKLLFCRLRPFASESALGNWPRLIVYR